MSDPVTFRGRKSRLTAATAVFSLMKSRGEAFWTGISDSKAAVCLPACPPACRRAVECQPTDHLEMFILTDLPAELANPEGAPSVPRLRPCVNLDPLRGATLGINTAETLITRSSSVVSALHLTQITAGENVFSALAGRTILSNKEGIC